MSPLRTLLSERRLVVAVGAGGVGKTTVAAALGVAAARDLHRRVVVLTVDPARRLADTLGVSIGSGPRRVTFESPEVDLHAELFEPAPAWDAVVQRELGPSRAARLLKNPMYLAITRRFVQSHDFIASERLHDLLDGSWDLVIVDTPPAGRALDFLDAPTHLASFFGLRSLNWFTGTASTTMSGLTSQVFQRIANPVLGGTFVSDFVDLFDLLREMVPGLTERSAVVRDAMTSSDAAAVVITTPETERRRQARDLAAALAERDVEWAHTVVNQDQSLADPVSGAQLERELMGARDAGALEVEATALASFVAHSLGAYEGAWGSSRERHEATLADLGSGAPLTFVRALAQPPNDLSGLMSLADSLLQ